MTSIVIVLPKLEDAGSIKKILARSGHAVTAICSTGAQAISKTDELNDGIVICSYKLPDMIFTELRENLPEGFEVFLLASRGVLEAHAGSGVMSLAMPLKVHELIDTVDMLVRNIERRRRRRKNAPKVKDEKEQAVIKEAKELLMRRNHMTEEEAHRYLQKCSMDSGTNIVETAHMVLALMRI